jgi:hypothetical protein
MTHHKIQSLSLDTLAKVTGGWWKGQQWNGGWSGTTSGATSGTTSPTSTSWGGWNGRGWGS